LQTAVSRKKHKSNQMNSETFSACGLAAIGAAEGITSYIIKPFLHDIRPSTRAWAALMAGVVTYDLLCPSGETLSEGIDSWMDKRPVVTAGAIGVTALHLMNILPNAVDPWHRALKLVKG
jgi:hypothetical protein